MDYDAIIFDIDGTLWNACAASSMGWNTGLSKLRINKSVTPKQIEGVAGHPFEDCIEILLPGLKDEYPQLLEILNDSEIEAVIFEGGVFYEGVIDGIKKLSRSNKIFLVSNCQDWYLKLFLEFSGLEDYLIDYDCNGVSGQHKNEMLSNIKSKYALKKPVYIGDTEGDEAACKIANIDFIHVTYGFGSSKNNIVNFDSFNSLVAYFEG